MEDIATLRKRFVALLIDLVIMFIITVILFYTADHGTIYGIDRLYVYYYMTSLWLGGTTIGGKIVKIKTVRSNNQKIGLMRAFLKGLSLGLVIVVISAIYATWWSLKEMSTTSFLLSTSAILLVFLVPLFSNKSLLDVISGSKVISNKSENTKHGNSFNEPELNEDCNLRN
jgi:uncharacterized RDD family membrane protein YckC